MDILPEVSRTFAINISFLSGDLYRAVLCCYLFCRIIDTIEDSSKLSYDEKIRAFDIWNEFFPFEKDWEARLNEFCELFNKYSEHTDNSSEEVLVRDSIKVFRVFHELDFEIRDKISPWILEMSKGMQSFQKIAKSQGVQPACIENLGQLEKYCYYVAGTVGEFLKELFFYFDPKISDESRKIMREYAVSFGLGLQITNIIKDFRDDKERNWCFVPKAYLEENGLSPKDFANKQNLKKLKPIILKLIDVTKNHLDNAFDFCMALPKCNKELRLFCLLPLHFAIQTLVEAKKFADNPNSNPIKITKSSVKKTILFTKFLYFSNSMQKWFYDIYRNQLSVDSYQQKTNN